MNNWNQPNEKENWKKECFFLLFLGILFSFLIKKCAIGTYIEILGTIREDRTVMVIVSLEQLPQLLEGRSCWIDKKSYSYQVLEVQEDILIEGRQFYKQVTLNVALPSDLLQVNSMFSLLISKEQKSLFHILPSCFKEG